MSVKYGLKNFEKVLDIIDDNICLRFSDIEQRLKSETGCGSEDYTKVFTFITSGEKNLNDYIIKRRLYFAACDLRKNRK